MAKSNYFVIISRLYVDHEGVLRVDASFPDGVTSTYEVVDYDFEANEWLGELEE